MFSIERRDELRETVYKIGDREFVIKDLSRGKTKKLTQLLTDKFKDLSAKFRDAKGEEILPLIYDEAGDVIAISINTAMGLQGEEKVTEKDTDTMTNKDTYDFAIQFSEDNMLYAIVEYFKKLLAPFWEDMLKVLYMAMRQHVVEGVAQSEVTQK